MFGSNLWFIYTWVGRLCRAAIRAICESQRCDLTIDVCRTCSHDGSVGEGNLAAASPMQGTQKTQKHRKSEKSKSSIYQEINHTLIKWYSSDIYWWFINNQLVPDVLSCACSSVNTQTCDPDSHDSRVLWRCSNNSATVSARDRSIFISEAIDFFLIKTLNCNKFKEKEHWVQMRASRSRDPELWSLPPPSTTAQLSSAQTHIYTLCIHCGWHFSERCVIDFSITAGND